MQALLIIDASPDFVTPELTDFLRRQQISPTVVGDGREGLQRAISDRPAAIVVSAELPGMSGYSVCARLKKDASLKSIPLVITSADRDTQADFENHRRLKIRADEYLAKPFAPGRLLEVLQPHLKLPVMPLNDFPSPGGLTPAVRPSVPPNTSSSSGTGSDFELLEELSEDADSVSSDSISAELAPPAKVPPRGSTIPTPSARSTSLSTRDSAVISRDSLLAKQQLNLKEHELLNVRSQITEREREILSLRERELELERRVVDEAREKEAALEALADAEERAATSEQRSTELETAIRRMEQDHSERTGEMQRRLRRAMSRESELTDTVGAANREIESLRSQELASRDALSARERDLAVANTALDDSRGELARLEHESTSREQSLRGELSGFRGQLEERERALAEAVNGLQKQVEQIQRLDFTITSLNNERRDLADQLVSGRTATKAQATRMADLTAELEGLRREQQSLANQLSASQAEATSLREQHAANKGALTELENKLSVVHKSLDKARQAAREEVGGLRGQIQERDRALAEAERAFTERADKFKAMEAQVAQRETDLVSLRAALAKAEEQLGLSRSGLADAKEHAARLDREHRTALADAKDYAARVDRELKEALAQKDKESKEHGQRIDKEHREAFQRLEKDYKEALQRLEKETKEQATLREQVGRLDRDLKTVRERATSASTRIGELERHREALERQRMEAERLRQDLEGRLTLSDSALKDAEKRAQKMKEVVERAVQFLHEASNPSGREENTRPDSVTFSDLLEGTGENTLKVQR